MGSLNKESKTSQRWHVYGGLIQDENLHILIPADTPQLFKIW